MKKVNRLVWTLLTIGALLLSSAYGEAQQPLKMRVAYVAPIGVMAPFFMAEGSGAFQREGLNVDLRYIAPSASIAALVSKEVDALEISAPGTVPAVLGGADVTMIAGLVNKMIFSLHAQKDIKTPDHLRGKVVGTDRQGTPTDYGARRALRKVGLDPQKDVQLLPIGGTGVLWPALQSGQIAGATLTPPQSFSADSLGFTRLGDTYDMPYQNVGVVVRKSDVGERPQVWVHFLRAVQQGIARWYDDPKLAKEVLTKYTKETNPQMLDKTYEFFTKYAGLNRDLSLSDEGIQAVLDFLGDAQLPAAKKAKPEQIYDKRILDLLNK